MTKICLYFVILAITIMAVMSAPFEEEERADRHKRVTCDLFSFGGKVGDSACAANCITLGKAGGTCNKGVCSCRKTTLKKVWQDRFPG